MADILGYFRAFGLIAVAIGSGGDKASRFYLPSDLGIARD